MSPSKKSNRRRLIDDSDSEVDSVSSSLVNPSASSPPLISNPIKPAIDLSSPINHRSEPRKENKNKFVTVNNVDVKHEDVEIVTKRKQTIDENKQRAASLSSLFMMKPQTELDLDRKRREANAKRRLKKPTILNGSNEFQLTKRSKGNDAKSEDENRPEDKSRSSKRRKNKFGKYRMAVDIENNADENIISDVSDNISVTTVSSASDNDGGLYYETDGVDEVERLFERCEDISKRLQNKVERLTADANGSNSIGNSQLITGKECKKLFPAGFSLKNYQLLGVNWLHMLFQEKVNGILADEMGLGKTIQAIALLAILKHRHAISGTHVVIAPGSTLENWRREIAKWLPNFQVVVYHGSMEERSVVRRKVQRQEDIGKLVNIILTTYTYFERQSGGDDRNFFYNREFEYIIFDEAHAIKNMTSSRYQRLMKVRARRKLLLSGTPVQNNLNELLAMMSFTMPKVFVAESEQLTNYFKDEQKKKREMMRLRKALKPFVLRRVKKDVLSQLPPKEERVIELEINKGSQAALYAAVLDDFKKKKDEPMSSTELTNIFVKLRKICNHPLLVRNYFGLFDEGENVDRTLGRINDLFYDVQAFGSSATKAMIEKETCDYSDWQLHLLCTEHGHISAFEDLILPAKSLWESNKFCYLRDLLPQLQKDQHRIVLFSQWTTILDILEELLQQLNMKYLRFDGQTQIKDRQDMIDQYNSDASIFVFLLSTRAGGLGINLTSADTVILHDLDFNPTIDQQAMDRVHRIGQTKPVTVYKLVSKNTVDQKIYEMQLRKMELDDKLFDKGEMQTNTTGKKRKAIGEAHLSTSNDEETKEIEDDKNDIKELIEQLKFG